MDPDAALEELRRLTALILDEDRQLVMSSIDGANLGEELAEGFAALDGWLSGGGFPPREWQDRPPTTSSIASTEGGGSR